MSMSLPPSRRHNPYRNSITIPHTPPHTPPPPRLALTPEPLGPPSVAGSSASAGGASTSASVSASASTSAVNGSMSASTSTSTASAVGEVSATEMDSHLAVLDGALGPPGASRRPSRRVRSIERTWHWVRSRSSVYGEAALMNLEAMSEEGGSHSTPPDHDPGPSRPLTMAFPAESAPQFPLDPVRRQSAADVDPEERRRRRQGLTPESGLRPPPRPRPVSRAMTTPSSSAVTGRSSPLADVGTSKSVPAVPTVRTSSPTKMNGVGSSAGHSPNGGVTPRPRPTPIMPPLPSTATSPTSSISSARTPVQSISDIVRRHSTAVTLAEETAKDRARAELASQPDLLAERRARDAAARAAAAVKAAAAATDTTTAEVSSRPSSPSSRPQSRPSTPPPPPPPPKVLHRREPSTRSSISYGSSDTDSVVRDYRLVQAAFDQLSAKPIPPTPPTPVSKTFTPPAAHPPTSTPTPTASSRTIASPTPERRGFLKDRKRGSPDELSRQRSTTPLRGKSASPHPADNDAVSIALYLRSAPLNRVISLPRPFPERPLQVSFADLGKADGRPVVVFLGLGCVRYLIALYDDLARTLGLRIICIDRWGLGKTDQVPQDRRGLLDWADVVRGVLDELGIERFQVVAHSAGAPYALACVLRMERRVHGKVHLLSPWVGGDVDGYKWLKWVPNGVIKSAIAAEWRLESYFLGKAPTLKHSSKKDAAAAAAAAASQVSLERPSFSSDTTRSDTKSERNVSHDPHRAADPFARVREHIPLETGEGFAPFAPVSPFASDGDDWAQAHSFTTTPAFAHALMQASHAESLSGTTADLLSVVLGRDAKPWGFSYTDIRAPCKIWYGALDDRVSEKSMRWMERAMGAELIVVGEEGHNLMSSRTVMYDVLDSLAEDI